MLQGIAFYLLAAVATVSGLLVVTARNPVHSVLWLILAFFSSAGLFVLLGAEFLAMLLVVVYVGAVAVLFLFVVMMLDIDFTELRAGFVRYLPAGLALAVLLAVELVVGAYAWTAARIDLAKRIAPTDVAIPNIEAIGQLLYSRYLYVFEGVGLVLLVAMIGAIVLTHRERSGSRYQNIARQNARRPQDATRNVRPEIGQGVQL